jgi:hypothetical protein
MRLASSLAIEDNDAMKNNIKDMLLALSDAGVAFVVAGGVAAVMHGVERMTLDLDVSVQMEFDNVHRFLSAMRNQGLQPRVPVPPEMLLDPVEVRRIVTEKHALVFTFIDPEDPFRHVDVFLTDELRYEAMITDAVSVAVEGRTIAIASIERLLVMKRAVDPPRPKDALDIAELTRIKEQG